jgi:hypothetical protein
MFVHVWNSKNRNVLWMSKEYWVCMKAGFCKAGTFVCSRGGSGGCKHRGQRIEYRSWPASRGKELALSWRAGPAWLTYGDSDPANVICTLMDGRTACLAVPYQLPWQEMSSSCYMVNVHNRPSWPQSWLGGRGRLSMLTAPWAAGHDLYCEWSCRAGCSGQVSFRVYPRRLSGV